MSEFDDDVSITVDGQRIAGWETVEITRSNETFPGHFSLTMSEEFTPDPAQFLAPPGRPCEIRIGTDLVLTGVIDRYAASLSQNSHGVTVSGRGICADLVDCACDIISDDSPIKGGSVVAANVVELAEKLCKSFNIAVVCLAADRGRPITTFQVALGETPYEVLERAARYTAFLIYEDEFGRLVLDRAPDAADKSRTMATGFAQGVNVEDAAVTFAVDERFTDLTVVFSPVDKLKEGPGGLSSSNQRAHEADPALAARIAPRVRQRIVASAQTDGTPDFAQRMAIWEMNRRIGRSQSVQLTCDKWRDQNGLLWQPNWIAHVAIPQLKLASVDWAIGTVVFRKDSSGTHANLMLLPPLAFSVQPAALNVWDYEAVSGKPASQSPAPATTTPPNEALPVPPIPPRRAAGRVMNELRVGLLEQRIERLERMLRLQFALSRSTAPAVDTGAVQTNQGQIDPLSFQDGMPTLLNYGFSSSLPVGGDKVVVFMNGDRSQGVVVATGHQAHRFTGLLPGESVMHDMWGNTLRMTQAGVIITAPSGVQVTTPSFAVTGTGMGQVTSPSLATTGVLSAGNGATGTYSGGSGHTLTVANGIVTNIT